MKVKILKTDATKMNPRWKAGQELTVTNEKAKELIEGGLARELRMEIQKDDRGKEYSVEVEIIDKSAKILKAKDKPTE
jgi:hypothetical protein